jgi:hypothetical protein
MKNSFTLDDLTILMIPDPDPAMGGSTIASVAGWHDDLSSESTTEAMRAA